MTRRIFSIALATLATLIAGPTLTSAHTIQYEISLSGPNESPANSSPGVGTGLVTVDLDLATMRVETSFSGLQGNVTAAHIHCCTVDPGLSTAGVATPVPTFPDFPSGVTAGSYDRTFDLAQSSSYSPNYINNNGGTVSTAMNAMLNGFDSGRAYLNIHTTSFGGGEIRGFLRAVPEPNSGLLCLIGWSAWAAARRKRVAVGS